MADENNTDQKTGAAEVTPPAEIAPPKKRRGPRPKHGASEATSEIPAPNAAQPVRGRRKGAGAQTEGKTSGQRQTVARTKAKSVAKAEAGKTRAEKRTAEAPAPVLDGIADLLQLEEENARLRKALAEKLRAENADLRKRLGLA